MTTSVLQIFLRESLLDLDGDDNRLEKLHEAATALSADFAAHPLALALPALFAALGEDDGLVNAGLNHTSEAIEKQWSTYRGAFKEGRATTLYRAVALQGLVQAIGNEPRLGTAVALLMRNLFAVLPIGKYRSAIQMVVNVAEAAFASECLLGAPPASEVKRALPAAAKVAKIDRAALQKRIEAAVGPHNRQGQPIDSPNPNWPNAGNPWSFEFSDRLTAIIGDYVDYATAEASKLDARNHVAIGASIAAVAEIDPAIKRSAALLWWRQALYSTSAKQPYRSLPSTDAVVYAVIDLASQIPPAYEPAMDSFLMEAILALDIGEEESDIGKFDGLSAEASAVLAEAIQHQTVPGLAISVLSRKDNCELIAKPSLLPRYWAVWLMRELMAVRIAHSIQEEPKDLDGKE